MDINQALTFETEDSIVEINFLFPALKHKGHSFSNLVVPS